MDFPLPDHIKKIMVILTGRGFAAYVVGGAVRDWFLGVTPHDYDVATDATPEEIGAIAKELDLKIVDKLGNLFGVIILAVDKNPVEIGTFRKEHYGADAHRPEKVVFCRTLAEDLNRRDFTINAMAVGEGGEVIDPYGGRTDIEQKRLRTVGDADERFAEDGLRMFRACRFCARLGFLPAPELLEGIKSQRKRAWGLSLERVKSEMEKLLTAAYPGIGLLMLAESDLAGECCSFKLKGGRKRAAILPELRNISLPREMGNGNVGREYCLNAMARVPNELTLRWAALFYLVVGSGRPAQAPPQDGRARCGQMAAAMAERVLSRFLYGDKFIRRVFWLLNNCDKFTLYLRGKPGFAADWLRVEAQSGYFRANSDLAGAFSQLCALYAVFAEQYSEEEDVARLRQFSAQLAELSKAMPVHTSDLAIGAADTEGYIAGGMTGVCLNSLLRKTQAGELANSRSELLAYMRRT